MTQKDYALYLFYKNGGQLRLWQIMGTTLAAEYRARFSELRKEGYVIHCQQGKKPSDNLYTLVPPEKNGQLCFAA